MASSSVTARRYFEALSDHDLEVALACWAPGAVDRLAGHGALTAPDGVRDYYAALFAAFPDFRMEVVATTTQRERCAVRWRATGTFAGPGRFQGFAPNGAPVEFEGCDVLQVEDGLIRHNDAYMNTADVARQLGVLPAIGSATDVSITKVANVRAQANRLVYGGDPELIAPGVWILRGLVPRTMNVYLIEDDGGVVVFDTGISAMHRAVVTAAVKLGGIRRVVLSHADWDHRGGAAGISAPIVCHPAERSAAESPSPFRDYWDLSRLSRMGRLAYPRLVRAWDGGAVQIAGTIEEGDEVAGFKVVHFPGHAPGLIGLFREEDRLALVSDCLYTINPETGLRQEARVPHPALNLDTDQARDSIRKLATLRPSVVWAGHANPVAGDDVDLQLQRAAAAPV